MKENTIYTVRVITDHTNDPANEALTITALNWLKCRTRDRISRDVEGALAA